MGTFVAIGLIAVAIVLFVAGRIALQKGYLEERTLNLLQTIATLVAFIAAVLIFVVPSPGSFSTSPSLQPSQTPLIRPSTQATKVLPSSTALELTQEPTKTQVVPSDTPEPMPTATLPSEVRLEDMPIVDGTWIHKPDTVIRGEEYPKALFFPQERIVVRTLQKYRTLIMKVGVDDGAGLNGFKHFWIKDHKGTVLFEGDAKPVVEPVLVEADVSQAEWVEITALDYNGQPGIYIRWIDVKFVAVPESDIAQPIPTATSSDVGVPLEQMPIIEGTYARKPDTLIRGLNYPNALYFDNERIVVSLLKQYVLLRLRVAVDDRAGLGGFKHFWVKDENGIVLFEGDAKPVLEPVLVEADISQADWIEITAIDYNGQPGIYIRWLDVEFIR